MSLNLEWKPSQKYSYWPLHTVIGHASDSYWTLHIAQYLDHLFVAYFTKIKVGLSNHKPVSVCVCPTNNFVTGMWILMKFGRQVIPLKMTIDDAAVFNLVA
jgi:hypothetical protein